MSEERAARLGLAPRARFVTFATAGADPVSALQGPVPATSAVLTRAGLAVADIDAFEVHEDFAVTVLAWLAALGVDPGLVNADGGALAFGDPLGASGLRLAGSLLARLERSGGRYGLQTMAGGGGVATAMILERL
jgi:acetyl-CoA acyltransferase